MPEALGCQERPSCCRREAQEGATEPDTHPADGADVHGLRVVAAVEQPLSLQQHGQTGLRGRGSKTLVANCSLQGHETSRCTLLDCPQLPRAGLAVTFEPHGSSFFQGVRFSVQTTSRGRTA